jgi:hypothetical protein
MTHVPDSLSSRRRSISTGRPIGVERALASFRRTRRGPERPGTVPQHAPAGSRCRHRAPDDGVAFDARIKGFDRYAVIVDVSGAEHLVFKHAIAFIETARLRSRRRLPHALRCAVATS